MIQPSSLILLHDSPSRDSEFLSLLPYFSNHPSMRIYISLLSLLSFVVALMLTPMVSAIPYPSTTPSGEV